MTKHKEHKLMSAIQIRNYGGPEQLVLVKLPIPEPKEDQILVQNHAVGINPYEWKLREGLFKAFNPVTFPVIPGMEAAGTIVSVGSKISKFSVGQEVYGFVSGSYAEYSLATENQLYFKPSHLSFEEAAAIPVGTQTAWSVLFDIAQLEKGEKVLIHGGAGTVGIYAIQLAEWKGSNVITTTSKDNIGFVHSLGADVIIDYQSIQFDKVIQNIDVVIDSIGGDVQNNSFKVLKQGGVLVSIISEPSQEMAGNYGVRALLRSSGISAEGLKQLQLLINSGVVNPFIRKTFSLADAGAAQDLSRSGHGRGKIVLKLLD
jgi:NADPH:quinone reductase-like Zn-dependent oxidoreductase